MPTLSFKTTPHSLNFAELVAQHTPTQYVASPEWITLYSHEPIVLPKYLFEMAGAERLWHNLTTKPYKQVSFTAQALTIME